MLYNAIHVVLTADAAAYCEGYVDPWGVSLPTLSWSDRLVFTHVLSVRQQRQIVGVVEIGWAGVKTKACSRGSEGWPGQGIRKHAAQPL